MRLALNRRVSTPLWSMVVLFAVAVVIGAAAYLAAVHNYQASQASQQRQAAQQEAVQRAQGAAIERKLCTSLEPLAALTTLKPPAGNPADNPSRAFEQQLVVKLAPLAQLGPDLGCKP
jgi:uncharacterized protein HemX